MRRRVRAERRRRDAVSLASNSGPPASATEHETASSPGARCRTRETVQPNSSPARLPTRRATAALTRTPRKDAPCAPFPGPWSAPSPSLPPARWPPPSSPRPPRPPRRPPSTRPSCRAERTWPSPTSRGRRSSTARRGSGSRRPRCGCSASPARRTSSAPPTRRVLTASSSASSPTAPAPSSGRADIYQTELSDDGQRLVSTKVPSNRKTIVTVWSATSGDTVASRSFKGYASALDADTDRVLVGGPDKTWLWTTSTNSVGVVVRDSGYAGDLSGDVLATYTKDPYQGGCTVVRTLSTGAQLWKSCKERVEGFNADGSRMTTVDILSDGIGPGYVAVRGTHRAQVRRLHGQGLVRRDRLRDHHRACCSRPTARARRPRSGAPTPAASGPATCLRPTSAGRLSAGIAPVSPSTGRPPRPPGSTGLRAAAGPTRRP